MDFRSDIARQLGATANALAKTVTAPHEESAAVTAENPQMVVEIPATETREESTP